MKFVDVIATKGPQVLGPLRANLTTDEVSFYAVLDGDPVLKNGQFGPESSFATEEEALKFAQEYAEYRKLNPEDEA